MSDLIQDKLKRSIQASDDLYHRLVLLVGKTGSGKTDILRNLADNLGRPIININLGLSSELLELTVKQRSLRLPELLNQTIDTANSPVLLDNLEILFDTSLKQNPLRLLQSISRNCAVLATWNGVSLDGKLVYAELGHPEYRSYDSVDALIVNMDGTATIDAAKST